MRFMSQHNVLGQTSKYFNLFISSLIVCVTPKQQGSPYLAMLSMALVGVTFDTRSRLLATLASFKAEGAHRRALWCVCAGETALTVLR